MSDNIIKKLKKKKRGLKAKSGIVRSLNLWMMAVIGALGFSLAPVSSVFATSLWDTAIKPTSTLTIISNNGLYSENITHSFLDIMATECSGGYASLMSAMSDEDGRWAIIQADGDPFMNPAQKDVYVFWSTNSGHNTSFISSPGYDIQVPIEHYAVLQIDNTEDKICSSTNTSYNMNIGVSGDNSIKLYASTYPVSLPSGYAGDDIPTPDTATDYDGDGLVEAYEDLQGTSDTDMDTDSDGINDLKESVWFEDRNDVFCGMECAYPNPLVKDLYVQIDWTDDGTEEYKPTGTQLALVADKFSDMDIIFHADTGQFGGGNELTLPSYEATIDVRDDFYSYKYGYETEDPANFDINHHKIWHYMIAGYNFYDGDEDSDMLSGKAEPGGDDTFISFGLLQDNPGSYSNFDDATAGTIVHELGHNLCLTGTSYMGQDSACLFSDIDNDDDPSVNYRSAMNYDYQFTNDYAYSDGTNGTGDHDDLAGIAIGFNDFLNDDDSLVGGPE